MKRIWVAAVLVVLALWVAYDLGYHNGRRNEQAAWEATRVAGLTGDDDFQKLPGRVRTDQLKAETKRFRIFYTDPHARTGYVIRRSPAPCL